MRILCPLMEVSHSKHFLQPDSAAGACSQCTCTNGSSKVKYGSPRCYVAYVMANPGDDVGDTGGPTPAAPLAEQLDEVELLEAMVGRAGEFEWRQEDSGRISGKLQVFLHLEQELDVCVIRREKYVYPRL